MKFNFRLALLTILLGLLLITVTLLGLSSYRHARFTVEDLTQQILDQTSLRIDQETEQLLNAAVGQTQLNQRLLASEQLHLNDFGELTSYWVQVLRVHPQITSVFVGLEATGESVGVSRLGGGKRAGRHDDAADDSQGLSIWQLQLNPQTGRLGLKEFVPQDYPDKPFVADLELASPPQIRGRPWYALTALAGRPTWSDTYVFLGVEGVRQVHGVTYATPVYDRQQQLVGVVTADFVLNSLCTFLQSLSVGQGGLAFVVEVQQGGKPQVIAHPQSEHLVRDTLSGDGQRGTELVPSHEFADRRVPALLGQLPADLMTADSINLTPVRFAVDGVPYLGGVRRLAGADSPNWLICMVLPEKDVLARVHDSNRQTAILGLSSLALAVILALYVSRQVAHPLERLSLEVEAIGRLQLDEQPVAHSLVLEVDRLAVALEGMKSNLRSFSKYVPADLVRTLVASRQEARLGGERRVMTVSFSDIVNFTNIAERLDADVLVEHLREYLSAVSAEVTAQGGTVDKYIGDAVMAFWGAPAANPRHALAACTAALRCQARLAELRPQWQAAGKPPLESRIGLNTGEMIVGNIGSAARLNYTVVGDAVNLASRLEGLNKQYGTNLLISQSTYDEVREAVLARPLDWVSVKGKSASVKVYELLALSSEATTLHREIAGLHGAALDLYRQQDWTAAIAQFEQVLRLDPHDEPAQRMIARCRILRENPPGDNWDGVLRLAEK